MVELLAPGGSLEGLKAAVGAGADAVYMGGSRFGARAYAQNPGENELLSAMDYCHLHDRKLYLTVNTLLKEKELERELYDYLAPAYEHGLDAVLVQDLGVFRFIQKHFPGLALHASTQMTISSVDGAMLLKEMGAERIVLSRELSLKEISEIYGQTGMEIECFVHGALCYCYSGQCLMSSMIGGRSGNRGRCAQPCRLPYDLFGEGGQRNDPARRYLLSLKDICTLELLPDLIQAGVCSFKIEGRMKRAEYAAGVTEIYRTYIDRFLGEGLKHYRVDPEDERRLMDLYNRGGFSKGYYYSYNGKHMMSMERPNHQGTAAARVLWTGDGRLRLEALEPLWAGDALEADLQPGNAGKEWVLRENAGVGNSFSISGNPRNLRKKQILSRVRCEKLLRDLREKYLFPEIQEKIKGNFILKQEKPAILKVMWKNLSVTVQGEKPMRAEKRPMDEETASHQLRKTGGTPFAFEELGIDMDSGLFYPLQKLNELRRDALAALEGQILASFLRPHQDGGREVLDHGPHPTEDAPGSRGRGNAGKGSSGHVPSNKPEINASVETFEQLDALLGEECVAGIYLDCGMFAQSVRTKTDAPHLLTFEQAMEKLHGRKKKGYLILPPVWRAQIRREFEHLFPERRLLMADGFVLKISDQLMYLRRFAEKRELIADSSIYTYNRAARDFLGDYGIDRDTLPLECTRRELEERGCEGSECLIYGHLPLMVTAQCLIKNTSGCRKKPELLYLKDRKGVEFPVRNQCSFCTNTIYNSVPLELISCLDEILPMHPASLRLAFTVENGETAREIVRLAKQALGGETVMDTSGRDVAVKGMSSGDTGILAGTRGHFRRGVE